MTLSVTGAAFIISVHEKRGLSHPPQRVPHRSQRCLDTIALLAALLLLARRLCFQGLEARWRFRG